MGGQPDGTDIQLAGHAASRIYTRVWVQLSDCSRVTTAPHDERRYSQALCKVAQVE